LSERHFTDLNQRLEVGVGCNIDHRFASMRRHGGLKSIRRIKQKVDTGDAGRRRAGGTPRISAV